MGRKAVSGPRNVWLLNSHGDICSSRSAQIFVRGRGNEAETKKYFTYI